jgi:hypothetical protein
MYKNNTYDPGPKVTRLEHPAEWTTDAPSCETLHSRSSKQIERRTLNIEGRTSNMDGATLYLILNKRITLETLSIDCKPSTGCIRPAFGMNSGRM